MDMDGRPPISLYDLMEEEGELPEGGDLVLLIHREGSGLVNSSTGRSVDTSESRGGFVPFPTMSRGVNLSHSRIKRIAEKYNPGGKANFYSPVMSNGVLIGIQYYDTDNSR